MSGSSLSDWCPQAYLQFSGERDRPALDLLAQLPSQPYARIHDLGCGPGNSTALLAAAFGNAVVTGIDNSPTMLAAARARQPELTFEQADITVWQAPADADLLFSNATFQWLEKHAAHLQRLLMGLKPHAVLAVQMPDNLNQPSHALMREIAARPVWKQRLGHAAASRENLLSPHDYDALLAPYCQKLTIWHTVYYHRLKDVAAIVAFLRSTGLRPYLSPLSALEQAEFVTDYQAALEQAYPRLADGSVLLAFPRLFMIAHRGD